MQPPTARKNATLSASTWHGIVWLICLTVGFCCTMALRRLGYPPLVVDLLPEPGLDDDHVLAIFKQAAAMAPVAKSNFVGLRYREPVYRSLRELVMSYFEAFYNVDGLEDTARLHRAVESESVSTATAGRGTTTG